LNNCSILKKGTPIKITTKNFRLLVRNFDKISNRLDNKLLKEFDDTLEISGLNTRNEWFRASIRKFLDDIEQLDQKFLGILAHDFGGGPVRAKTIVISAGEEERTIEEVYEPYLIQIGFIKRTPEGRETTEAVKEHLKKGG
jgi:Holliday junction DNA helicase RuvB